MIVFVVVTRMLFQIVLFWVLAVVGLKTGFSAPIAERMVWLVLSIILAAFLLFVVRRVRAGSSSYRAVLNVYGLLGLGGIVPAVLCLRNPTTVFEMTTSVGVLVLTVLFVVALVLLNTKASNVWFKEMKKVRNQTKHQNTSRDESRSQKDEAENMKSGNIAQMKRSGWRNSFSLKEYLLGGCVLLTFIILVGIGVAQSKQTILGTQTNRVEKNVEIGNGVVLTMIHCDSNVGSFWVGKFKVTQEQWKAVTGTNPSHFVGDQKPVDSVSFNDCFSFISTLNELPAVRKAGLAFRLPTVQEWIACCKAGATGPYCLLEDGTEADYSDLDEISWIFLDLEKSSSPAVGLKRPNAFGLFDMISPLGEWTRSSEGPFSNVDSHKMFREVVGFNDSWLNDSCFSVEPSSPSEKLSLVGFRLFALDDNDRKRRRNRTKQIIQKIIADMVYVPGTSFMIGAHEVTQEEWNAVVGDSMSACRWANENCPISGVSYLDCMAFIHALNSTKEVRQAGLTFSIPTDKQWEKACSAGSLGSRSRLRNGTEISAKGLESMAWYKDNSGSRAHSVGDKQPNAWGFYDMLGNVGEWVYVEEESKPAICGGSFDSPRAECVSSAMDRVPFDQGDWYWGFRLAAIKSDAP